jgi:hypothetical protein
VWFRHHSIPTGQAMRMNPYPPSGGAGLRRLPWRRPWRSAAVRPAAAAVIAVTAGVAVAAHGGSDHATGTMPVSVAAGGVQTVDLLAVPGKLTIAGAAAGRAGRVTLTGELNWTGSAPQGTARLAAPHLLRLSYRCAAASPCSANWRLVVPRDAAVVLSQPAGHVVISGLAGPLRIIAASVDVSATGLRSGSLQAAITSGHLGATFDVPPSQVSLSLVSAQATLSLPGSVDYAVSDQVTSGYVRVGIPEAARAEHTVTASVDSGELSLLAS